MTQPPERNEPTEQHQPTVFGETRAQWEEHLARMHGQPWVEAQRGFLGIEWAHLIERWGDQRAADQRDPDAPRPTDPNANLAV